MVTKKRRLGDLYVVGRSLTFDDGHGEPVTVWLQKLNPMETEQAARRAGSAKARVLLARNDRDSEEWQNVYGEATETSRSDLVDMAISEKLAQSTESADAEISASDEWSKDDYLQGLRDAWAEKLYDVHTKGDKEHEDYADAKRTFEELSRFDKQVTDRVLGEQERLRRDMDEVPDEELYEIALERLFSFRSETMWVREFRRSQIWLGVREPEDHKTRYFNDRSEVDELPTEILTELMTAMGSLVVDATEGKDLPPTPSSSQPSEQQNEGETAASSGLKVVAQ